MNDYFFDPTLFYTNVHFVDDVIRGFVKQPSQRVDTQVTDQLWIKLFVNLFGSPNPPVGAFDIAYNTQRGRDHGLPGYNFYRQLCGLPALNDPLSSLPTRVNSSKTSIPYFDKCVVAALASVYASVNDIDLYVGGLAQLSTLGDGIVGPTFTCIIAENFQKLKYSDRFFYESEANPHPFSPAQLTEIKKASMARIFCDNSDGTVTTMQPLAFNIPGKTSTTNQQVPCNNITTLNLNLWKTPHNPNNPPIFNITVP